MYCGSQIRHRDQGKVAVKEFTMSGTPIYFLGFVIFIAGLAWGAFTLGVPPTWIAISCTVLAGIALMSTVSRRETTTVVPRETYTADRVVVEG